MDNIAIRVRFGWGSRKLIETGFLARIRGLIRHFQQVWGVLLPPLELTMERALPANIYRIEVLDQLVGEGEVIPGRLLAVGEDETCERLLGEPGVDPIYGLSGRWIVANHADAARELGLWVFEPEALVATHMIELLQRQLHRLLSLEEVKRRLDEVGKTRPRLVKEMSRRCSLLKLKRVLQLLLREQISISNLGLILEGIATVVEDEKPSAEDLLRGAREMLKGLLTQANLDEAGRLATVVLSHGLERRWSAELDSVGGLQPLLSVRFLADLGWELGALADRGVRPVLVVQPALRLSFVTLLERSFPDLPVISWNELPTDAVVFEAAVLGSRVHPLVGGWNVVNYDTP